MLRNTPLRVRDKHQLVPTIGRGKAEPTFQSRRIRVVTRIRPVQGHRNNHNRPISFQLLPKKVQAPQPQGFAKVANHGNDCDIIHSTDTMDTVHSSSSSEDLQIVDSQESETSITEPAEEQLQTIPESPARKLFSPGSLYGKTMSPSACKKAPSTALEQQLASEPSSRESTPVTRNTRSKDEACFFPSTKDEEEIVFESIVIDQTEIQNPEKQQYDMDLILDSKTSQAKLFQDVASDAIKKEVLKGYNSTFVTYGASKSGKSFSLFGNRVDKRDDHIKVDDGIFQRSVAELLEAKRRCKTSMSLTEGKEVHLEMTICEIDGDLLRDLSKSGEGQEDKDTGNGPFVPKLQAAPIISLGQARRLFQQSFDRRRKNSHLFVTIYVRVGEEKIAKLSLCDLAATNQSNLPIQSNTAENNEDDQLSTEDDLKVLEKVVNTLAKYDDTKSKMYARRFSSNNIIPYTDSQLTRMLREALGGNSSTTILACVNSQDEVCHTMSTLQFAERCRSIHCHYKQNTLPKKHQQQVSSTPIKTPQTKPPQRREESSIQKENKRLNGLLSRYRRHFQKTKKDGESADLSVSSSMDDGFSFSSISTKSTTWREQWALAKNLRAKVDKAREEAKEARSNNMKMMEKMESLRSRTKSLVGKGADTPPVQVVTTPQSDSKKPPASLEHPSDEEQQENKEDASTYESIPITATTSTSSSNTGTSISTHTEFPSDVAKEKLALESEVKDLREKKMKLQSEIAHLEQDYATKRRTLKREIMNLEVTRNMIKMEATKPVVHNEPDIETTPIKALKAELEQVQRNTQDSEAAHKRELEEIKKQNDVLKHEMAELRGQVVANSPFKPLESDSRLEASQSLLQTRVSNLSAKVLDLSWVNQSLLKKRDSKDDNSTSSSERSNLSKSKFKRKFVPWSRKAKRKKAESDSTSEDNSESSARRDTPKLVSCELTDVSSPHNGGRESTESSLSTTASKALSMAPSSLVISNMDSLEQSSYTGDCVACQSGGPFPGKPKQVEFYLPKLSIVCTCGKRSNTPHEEADDPLSLSHILRDWQVEFLAHLDIHDAAHFVRIADGKKKRLARMLRQYRKDHKLPSMGTKSCVVAIHIWARTCHAVIKEVEEKEAGSPVQKNVLEYRVGSKCGIPAGQLASVAENEPLPSVKEEDAFSDASSWLTNEI